MPCPWEIVAGYLSYKKLWFLGLKHITPKCSQNKILAVKNLENSVHTSVVSEGNYLDIEWALVSMSPVCIALGPYCLDWGQLG